MPLVMDGPLPFCPTCGDPRLRSFGTRHQGLHETTWASYACGHATWTDSENERTLILVASSERERAKGRHPSARVCTRERPTAHGWRPGC